MIVGRGGYGAVTAESCDSIVVTKTFEYAECILQEVPLSTYLRDCPYVVKLIDFNLVDLTTTMERWPESLRQYLNKNPRLEMSKRKRIADELLFGLAYIQSRNIVHSDIKPSNILINSKTMKVCYCDMGLSSLNMYSKVDKAAEYYQPPVMIKSYGHDMFALCITILELIASVPNNVAYREIKRVRYEINKYVTDSKYKAILLDMVPEDLNDAPTANEILRKYYNGKQCILEYPEFTLANRMPPEHCKYIKDTVIGIAINMKIPRELRCAETITNYINANYDSIQLKDYPRYIGAAILIFSSVFGDPKDIGRIVSICQGGVTRSSILDACNKLLRDYNFVCFMLIPTPQ